MHLSLGLNSLPGSCAAAICSENLNFTCLNILFYFGSSNNLPHVLIATITAIATTSASPTTAETTAVAVPTVASVATVPAAVAVK